MEKEGNELLTIVGAALCGALLMPVQPVLGGTLLSVVGMIGAKYYREHSRLAGVFRNCGLTNKDGQVLQLRERRYTDSGMTFRYSLPPGFSLQDVEKTPRRDRNVSRALCGLLTGIERRCYRSVRG